VARTNVKEARRTVRVVIFVTLTHPFNRESLTLDKKREERSNNNVTEFNVRQVGVYQKEKLKVKRVASSNMSRVFSQTKLRKQWRKLGSKSTRRYSKIIATLTTKPDRGITAFARFKAFGAQIELFRGASLLRWMSICALFAPQTQLFPKRSFSSVWQTSAVEREKKVQGFEAATEKPRNITKNQRRGDIFIPIAVGGGIALSYFAKKRKNESVVREEIAFREIKLDNVQLRLNEPPLETMELDKMKQQDRLLGLLLTTW